MAHVKSLEKSKRPYADISQRRAGSPGSSSPERKKRRICVEINLLKRPFSEVSKGSVRYQEYPSPERKSMRVSSSTKEDRYLPSTSKQDPSPMIQSERTRENASTYRDTGISDSMSREKKRKDDRTETKKVPKIWIIGSSYIHRGETAAHENFRENFALNAKVEWFGKEGMRWSGVLPHFYGQLAAQSPPDILVVHAGGNDLGLISAKVLACKMVRDLVQLHKEFPSMTVAYSCINERQVWRNGQSGNMNDERKTVNTLMREAAGYFGGEVIEHPLLKLFSNRIFLPDGVHFNKEGNRVFVWSIRGALKKILQTKNPT